MRTFMKHDTFESLRTGNEFDVEKGHAHTSPLEARVMPDLSEQTEAAIQAKASNPPDVVAPAGQNRCVVMIFFDMLQRGIGERDVVAAEEVSCVRYEIWTPTVLTLICRSDSLFCKQGKIQVPLNTIIVVSRTEGCFSSDVFKQMAERCFNRAICYDIYHCARNIEDPCTHSTRNEHELH